jgi:hypothetical protein
LPGADLMPETLPDQQLEICLVVDGEDLCGADHRNSSYAAPLGNARKRPFSISKSAW